MRRLLLIVVLLGGSVLSVSCGTVHRYEYYDYSSPTIDEKNQARGEKLDRQFRGIMPGSQRPGRWRR